MKLDCGPSIEVQERAKQCWHVWFAWTPTRVGENDCRWLERIERKGTLTTNWAGYDWKWEYRALQTVITVRPDDGRLG